MRVIIIHGSYGSPDGNWFPWLKNELEMRGHTAVVPRFPTPEGQFFSNWENVFMSSVKPLDSNTVLIGHSVGAGFVLGLLSDITSSGDHLSNSSDHRSNSTGLLAESLPIKATYLIAGFLGKLNLPDYDPINETFVSRPFDFLKIRQNCGSLHLISSDNDPYVPSAKGTELAAKLGTPLHVIPNGGHLNAESGYTEFPFLLDSILSLEAVST